MAKKYTGIAGINKVSANITKQLEKIQNQSVGGLVECAILIRRDMDKTSPIVPVDTRNLQNSFFSIITNGQGAVVDNGPSVVDAETSSSYQKVKATASAFLAPLKAPAMVFGFSANYAVFVHEDMEATFKRPGSGPKFFELALKRNQKHMLQLIAKHAKI